MNSDFIEEISKSAGSGDHPPVNSEEDLDAAITVEQIAQLTDFPEDFIKKELLLGEEEISMRQFRQKVLKYLENTMTLLKD